MIHWNDQMIFWAVVGGCYVASCFIMVMIKVTFPRLYTGELRWAFVPVLNGVVALGLLVILFTPKHGYLDRLKDWKE